MMQHASLPYGCVKAGGIAARTVDTCTFYHGDAFLHNVTAQASRSVALMDSYSPLPTSYSALNVARLKKLFRKLMGPHQNANDTLNILAVGGSLTLGLEVGIKNAWPSRLEALLRKQQQSTRIRVFNRALGGTTSHWALNNLHLLLSEATSRGDHVSATHLSTVDLVIIDYDVNDCAYFAVSKSYPSIIASYTEVMLRRVLEHKTQPAVIYLNVATTNMDKDNGMQPHCDVYSTCYTIGETRLPVLRHYGVPLVSQKTALWYNFSCPPPTTLWPCATTCRHPRSPGHEVLATLLAAFLMGATAAHSAFGRSLLPSTSSSSAVNNSGTLPATFFVPQSADVESRMCREQSAGINAQVPAPIGDSSTLPGDGFYAMGTSAVQLQSRAVDLPANAGVARYATSGTNITASLTYSTIRVNTTVNGQPLRFAYRTCWRHVEDVRNKPGLVAEECFNLTRTAKIMSSTVEVASVATNSVFFPVTYGATPRLAVTFLVRLPSPYVHFAWPGLPLRRCASSLCASTRQRGRCIRAATTCTLSSSVAPKVPRWLLTSRLLR